MNQKQALTRRHTIRQAAAALLGAAIVVVSGTTLAQGQLRFDPSDAVDRSESQDNATPSSDTETQASTTAQSSDDSSSVTDRYEAESKKGLISRVFDYVKHNTYLSLGAIYAQSEADSSPLVLENAQGLTAQAFGGAGETEIEGGATFGSKLAPGGVIGLYVPHTNHHLAVEVLISGPLKTTFEATGAAANEQIAPTALNGENAEPIPTGVPPVGTKIGTLKALPPNFTIVYRPWVDTMLQPYIGVGAAYLYTYDTDVSNPVLTQGGADPTLNLTKPFACIGQLGLDISLPNDFFIKADARYLGCADVEATLNDVTLTSPTLSPNFGAVNVGSITTTAHFKAIIYTLGLGYRF